MSATEAPNKARRGRWTFDARSMLIPDGVVMVPDRVATANEAARAAHVAARAATERARQAREEMAAAPKVDAAADRAAAEAGEDMPHPSEPAKRAAFAIANREAQALGPAVTQRVVDLFEAIAAEREAWLGSLEPAVAKQRKEIADQLDTLAERYRELQASEHVLDAVTGYMGNGNPSPIFDVPGTGQRAQQRQEQQEATVAKQLASGQRHQIPREAPYLLEGLRQLAQEKPTHRRGQW